MRFECTGGVYERPSRDKRDYLFGSEPPVQWFERKYPPGERESKPGSTLMLAGIGALSVLTLGATVAPVLLAEVAKGAGAAAINQVGALGVNALSDMAAAGVGHHLAKSKYRDETSKFGRLQVAEIIANRDRHLHDKLGQHFARSAEPQPDLFLDVGLGKSHVEVKFGRKGPKWSTPPS
jgi:hypothetical protein